MKTLLIFTFLLPSFQSNYSLLELKNLSKEKPDSAIIILSELINQPDLDLATKGEYLYLIAKSYDFERKDTLALNSYLNASKIFEEINNKKGVVKTLYRIGVFHAIRHNISLAQSYFKQCLPLYQELGNKKRIAALNISISNLFYEAGNLQEAKKAYKSLFNDSIIINTPPYLADLNNNLATTYKDLKEFDSAIIIYKSSIEDYEVQVDSFRLVGNYHNIGHLYYELKKYDSAKYYIKKSLEYAIDINHTNSIKKAYYQLSFIERRMQNFKKAFNLYLNYDSLENIENNTIVKSQIAELQTKYETEKKDKELLLRQAKIDLTTAEKNRLMYILLVSVLFTLIIIYIYTQRQKTVKKLRKKEVELHTQEVGKLIHEQELKSLNSMLEGEEKERKRIAEDLHDRVGSMLSAMRLHLESTNTKAVELLDDTANEVRRISHNLETKVLNRFGLIAALEDLADKIESSEKILFELHHLDLDERLDSKLEINVYRIIQELISNTLKHSSATEIIVQVNRIEDQLIISVEDDGIGFNSFEVKSKGMGLGNIISRTNELNGEMNIDSGKGKGSIITIEIPL